LKSLEENHLIAILNVSKNNLTDNSCNELKNFIHLNDSLKEMYLHWNLFTSFGGKIIFEALI
jgi:hypothetical protein